VNPAVGTNNGTLTLSAATAALAAGVYNRALIVSANGASNSPQTINVTLTIQAPSTVVTWSNPAPIIYGTSLGVTQLNAIANVPGAFNYVPPAGTVLNAGNGQVLNASFVPADTTNYNATNASVTINVLKAGLTITADDKEKIYGADLPAPTATYTGFVNGDTPASLDIPVVLDITATAASPVGDYPITARDAEDASYAITHVDGTLTVTTFEFGWITWNETGQITIEVIGPTSAAFLIEASDDLQAWEPVTYVWNPNGTITIEGQGPDNFPQRYYRGIAP
jgi:hypothetical protein